MTTRFYILGGVPQQIGGVYALQDGQAYYALPKSGLPAPSHPGWADGTLDVASFGLFIGAATAQPAFDTAIQNAPAEAAPVQVSGVWTQQWSAPLALSAEQLAALIPQSVTAAQAKEALLAAGLYSSIVTYLSTAPQSQQIAWDSTTSFDRNSPTLAAMASALGITGAQLDALFVAAAKVVV
jgi:hypothetical protein